MGSPVLGSDGSEPFKRGPPNIDPPRSSPVKGVRQPPDRAPSGGPPETPPGKTTGRTTSAREPSLPKAAPRLRRGAFEGDAAAVELRARLAQARCGAPPAAPPTGGPAAGTLRFLGVILAMAAAAGAAGYLAGGFRSSSRLLRPPAAGRALVPVATVANVAMPGRDAELPAARTAAMAVPPSGTGPVPDASEIAARLKLGADLMAAGDITAARTMFERVAEAGEAAGAFALAETYDPAVLATRPLRGGIVADPALARQWYEKARDMGSRAAPERIARLVLHPQ